MANVIALSGPGQTQQVISHFLDQFNADQRARQEMELQRQQLAQTGQFQSGELQNQQQQLQLLKDKFNYDQMIQTVAPYAKRFDDYSDAIQSATDPARKAALQAQASSEMDSILQEHPDWKPILAIHSMDRIMTPKRQFDLNAAANAAARQAPGTTEPYAVAESTKSVTGDFPTAPMFMQAQASDLEARGKAGAPVPPPTAGIPAPSASPVSNAEAIATGIMPSGANRLTAQTLLGERTMTEAGAMARLKETLGQYLPTPDGAPNPQVAAVVNAIKTAKDPNDVLKKVAPNKKLYNAVIAQLSTPENAHILEQTTLGGAQKSAIAEIDPLIAQAKAVLTAYEPYKNDNSTRDTGTYLMYMLGQKPPDDSPASQLANLQMLRVQAGARLLKGGSRAYPALKMAMQHAGNGFIDTRANIYDKTTKLLTQLQRVRDSQAGTLEGAGAGATAADDPLGILH